MAIISTAFFSLLFGALQGDSFMRSTNTAQSEIEFAMRRIANNLREAQSGSIVIGTSTLTTVTQADTIDGYPSGATVSYALQPDPTHPGQQMLIEADQRYGTNVLIHHVTTFTAAATSTPALYQIDLIVGSQMQEERHFKVFARN
jgi:hypothetical protein